MSKLTIEEWTKITEKFSELYHSGDQAGKCYMTAIKEIKPDLHSNILGTEYDCTESENNMINLLYYLNQDKED